MGFHAGAVCQAEMAGASKAQARNDQQVIVHRPSDKGYIIFNGAAGE